MSLSAINAYRDLCRRLYVRANVLASRAAITGYSRIMLQQEMQRRAELVVQRLLARNPKRYGR